MTTPICDISSDAHHRVLIARMAGALVANGIDLGDEQAAIVRLVAIGFRGADVDKHLDEAIDRARVIKIGTARPEGMA
ncbi:hypothetical protein RA307_04915 [Xanthobacteraceae bacterium Astr-EGSB]|uniref:hypothetical protein n=1 Tax=Astrobacterium formosum TaxID=3069710 RepID=UPI0027B3EA3C|nr:hypothetical protein [Xanthobacteraceae bacterium Astr-EGSB]